MAFNITESAQNASERINKQPQIVIEIEGVDTLFTATKIKKFIRIGDADLEIGVPLPGESDVWTIGGLKDIEDQSDLIDSDQSSSTIRQSLQLDKGTGETISSIQVSFVDKNSEITNLISPGNVITDAMGAKARLWLGFADTAFKDDFIILFRGIIDDIEAGSGLVTLSIAHPDQKKRSKIFTQGSTELDGGIGSGDTTIVVNTTADFNAPVLGPDGLVDETIKFYARIEDEIVRYEGKTATSFTTVSRGLFGTTAAAHSDDSTVEALIGLTGLATDLALKLMLSGVNGDFKTGVEIENFVNLSASETLANSITFVDIDVEQEFGLTLGDFVDTIGATNGANNVTARTITEIGDTDDGTYIVVSGAALVAELDSAATISFRSQYDTLGIGIQMSPDEVDVAEHNSLGTQFLGSFDYDFLIEEDIDSGKEFLSEQIYNPAAAYSIPRKARASMGLHIPPLPTAQLRTIDLDAVTNPESLKIKRSVNKNFFNAIVYKTDKLVGEDKFLKTIVSLSTLSQAQIPVGNKVLTIEAQGMKSGTGSFSLAGSQATRRLKKFRFGAESIRGMKVTFEVGFNLEIGDVTVLDMAGLKLSDIQTGTRAGEQRLFQVVQKTFNIKTGEIVLDLVDTNFDKDSRFALISHSSQVKSGSSTTQFVIESGPFSSPFGIDEFKKWDKYIGAGVVVRSTDFSTSDTSTIQSISGNTIILSTALAFTPTAGMIMELDKFSTQSDDVTIIFGFMNDGPFPNSSSSYQML